MSKSPAIFTTFLLMCCHWVFADEQPATHLQLTLPTEIYATTGVPTCIYFDNIVLSETTADYRFEVTCDVGEAKKHGWWLTPGISDVGRHSLTITVFTADGKQVDTGQTMLRVTASDAGADHELIRLLIIGDSLTHATVYPNEVVRLLSQSGNPPFRMLGSHIPKAAADGVAHEGYGGWTWAGFVTKYEPSPDGTHRKRSSPFVFRGKDEMPALDLPRYFETHCDGFVPDYIVIMLGINDCFGAPFDDLAGIDAQIDTMFGHADQLISAFQKAAPSAQIGLCLTTPPNSRQTAFEANYQDRYTRWGWKRIQHRLVQRQINYVASKEDSRISAISTQLNLDPTAGYPENNGVHPNEDGYRAIGGTVYSWVKSRLEQNRLPAALNTDEVLLLRHE